MSAAVGTQLTRRCGPTGTVRGGAGGYALAGGAALIVQQIVERDTRDLDAFIAARPGPIPGTVDLLTRRCFTTWAHELLDEH